MDKQLPTVLIVEDEPLVRMLAIEEFEEIGFTVHTANDAAGALEMLERIEPLDLLFTDIQMPGPHNGWQLGRRARELRPDIAVIYATGYGGEQAEPVEHSATVRKPYLFADIIGALHAVGIEMGELGRAAGLTPER
ncbi:MAG: response regulator receiver protein [Novosphingobium sp.]|nr:response regulator receiver protein [Novosphingobium sp.]